VRLHVPERALTTWIVLDLSPSMAFGTGNRLKADVAEGAALAAAGTFRRLLRAAGNRKRSGGRLKRSSRSCLS